MLRSGKEHLERLRDGRVVYVGNERIDDVTTHPVFRNAARTVAAIYDMKADPAHRETHVVRRRTASAAACISCRRARRTICAGACARTRRSPT